MEKDMEKDYDKRTINIMGLTMIITAFITGVLLWFFLGGASLPYAIIMAFGYSSSFFIGWILIRGYVIRYLKEKRIQKNQAVVNKAK